MEWIDFKQRKPPQDVPVLVARYDAREKVKMHFITIGYRLGNRWFEIGVDGEGNNPELDDKYGYVSHWMPVPDPPTT